MVMDSPVYFQAIGSLLPDQVLSNTAFVAQLAHQARGSVPEEEIARYEQRATQIEAKVGIRERRFFDAEETPLHIALRLLERLEPHTDFGQLDAIIVASSSLQGFPGLSQQLVPALRQRHHDLGHPFVLDVGSNACTNFLYGVGIGAALMGTYGYRTVLCLSIELASRCIDTDIQAFGISTLFGDAAAAIVLSSDPGFAHVRNIRMGSQLTDKTLRLISGSGVHVHRPEQKVPLDARWHVEGPTVATSAVPLLVDEIRHYQTHDLPFDWLIPHQANLRRILLPACAQAGIPPEQMLTSIEMAANTSSASIPLTFDQAYRKGHLQYGDRVLLVSFGASFSVASALLEMTHSYASPVNYE